MMLLCLFIVALVASVESHTTGAGAAACNDANMTPGHVPTTPSSLDTTNPEFNVRVNSTMYAADDVIQVTIAGVEPFRGFLIMALTQTGTVPIGSFEATGATPPSRVQPHCGTGNNRGMTHSRSNGDVAYDTVELLWTAPSTLVGHLTFYATVVAQFNRYFVRVPSLSLSDGSTTTTPMGTTPPVQLTDPVEFSSCGQTKNCWTSTDCTASSCDFLISWKKASATTVDFEILASNVAANQYAAVGIAPSERMEDVTVIACQANAAGSASVNEYHAATKAGTSTTTTGTILSGSARLDNSVMSCRFTYDNTIAKNNLGVFKDLTQTNFHLFLARGSVSNGLILQHNKIPIVSPASQTNQFFSTEYQLFSDAATPSQLPKAHGALMVIAWCICIPLAVTLARYYKIMWPDSKLLGEKVWFTLHRALNLTAMLCTVIAFIIIVVEKRTIDLSNSIAHPVMGLIVVFFSIINPVLAAFRCHPGDGKRWIFNVFHAVIGSITFSLGLATMVLGTQFQSIAAPKWLWIPTTVYACWYAVQVALFEIHRCIIGYDKEKKPEADSKDIQMTSSKEAPSPVVQPWRYPGHTYRVILFAVSAFIAIGYGIFLIVMIAADTSSL